MVLAIASLPGHPRPPRPERLLDLPGSWGASPRASAVDWYEVPAVSSRYFSPDTSPGNGDTILYSFGLDQSATYEINISAYYKQINWQPSFMLGDSAAYLMPNGTWVVVTVDMRFISVYDYGSFLVVGTGTNASNLVWRDIGAVNDTDQFAVAANTDDEIRVVYVEEEGVGSTPFQGVRYYSSDDWGASWSSGTLLETTDWAQCDYGGISMDAFAGDFLCMWGISNTSGSASYSGTVWETSESGGSWDTPGNLTGLIGTWASSPQVMYNHTNDNGTLYVAYDYYQSGIKAAMVQLQDGVDNAATGTWTFPHPNGGFGDDPQVLTALDRETSVFYFIDTRDYMAMGFQGLRNATWGQTLAARPTDYFDSEADGDAYLYANDGPKCFAGSTTGPEAQQLPGILDAKTPFHVMRVQSSAPAYGVETLPFSGKDNNSYSREAEAYKIDITIDSGTLQNAIVVGVDNALPQLQLQTSETTISPFTSPGTTDQLTINVTSNRPGSTMLTVKSDAPIPGSANVTDGVTPSSKPAVAGDDTTKYVFFTETEGTINHLKRVKSTDGGLSWGLPRLIKSSTKAWQRLNALQTGTALYCWAESTSGELFVSYDDGGSFSRHPLPKIVHAVTADGACWHGEDNGTHYVVEKSEDLGYTWEFYHAIPDVYFQLSYQLDDAAYDPISGNYSLLVEWAWDDDPRVMFVTFTHDGAVNTTTVDIMQGATGSGTNHLDGSTKVTLWPTSPTTNEWAVFSNAYSMALLPDMLGYLSYRTTAGGGSFSTWDNYTALTGSEIRCSNGRNTFDVMFPEDGNPTAVVTTKPSTNLNPLTAYSRSNFLFGTSEILDAQYRASLVFGGVTGVGAIIPDGTYDWEVTLIDRAGSQLHETGTVSIDNNDPILRSYLNLTSPASPYPVNTTTVTIPVQEASPDTGLLYYRVPGDDWTIVPMTYDPGDVPNVNFTGTIPSQSEATSVYWKVEINDTSGNLLVVDNNGQLFSYSRGIFETVDVSPSSAIAPTLYDDWTWAFRFTSGEDHVQRVWLESSYDGGPVTETDISPDPLTPSKYSVDVARDTTHLSATFVFKFQSDTSEVFTLGTKQVTKPTFEYVIADSKLDATLFDEWSWQATFTAGGEYVARVWLERAYANGTSRNTTITPLPGTDTYNLTVPADLASTAATHRLWYQTVENVNVTMSEKIVARPTFESVRVEELPAPTLYDAWTWQYTFTSGTEYVARVFLQKIFADGTHVNVTIPALDAANATFGTTITPDSTHARVTYRFMYEKVNGECGLIAEKVAVRPQILLREKTPPPESVDLAEVSNFTVDFVVEAYAEYVDHVYVQYRMDDGTTGQANMTGTGAVYEHTFGNFSGDVTLVNYSVVAVDAMGTAAPFDLARVVYLIPAMPEWEMTASQQISVVIGALVVGVVCGVVYTAMTSQKGAKQALYAKYDQREIEAELAKWERGAKPGDEKPPATPKKANKDQETSKSGDAKQAPPGTPTPVSTPGGSEGRVKPRRLALGITLVALVACWGLGAVAWLVLDLPEASMLFFAGAFLAAVFLWVLLSNKAVEEVLRTKSDDPEMKHQKLLLALTFLIYGAVLAIFVAGGTVAWWRVRVNELSYNFSGFVVPKALTTVTTTFFSSILLLTWSTSKQVTKVARELNEARARNENPRVILQRREDALDRVIGNVGKKGIIFIALIGSTIVFASDLSTYADQGILFIVPFAVGALLTLMLGQALARRKGAIEETVLLDKLIRCSKCGNVTALGGKFCEICGTRLTLGKRFSYGVTCPRCKMENARGTAYCRYCNAKLPETSPTPAKDQPETPPAAKGKEAAKAAKGKEAAKAAKGKEAAKATKGKEAAKATKGNKGSNATKSKKASKAAKGKKSAKAAKGNKAKKSNASTNSRQKQ